MNPDNPKPGGRAGQQPPSGDEPFFSAILTPHRSLGPNGFLVLMLCTGAICFAAGTLFLSIGAWPVFGFFGLDVLLVWVAFRMNYASANAYEEVCVSAHEIVIRKVGPGKRRQEFRFNPFWVRLSVARLEDEGVTRIALSIRDQSVDIGAFLNPDDRTSFAGALAAAVATAKAGTVPR
ncbi:DUF2244 domain-containing protein [Polymorphum gilvum]|uniref:DUF2244 domain-containing protein n=1 Tax=Polymorphum gilvum (strain LMG 25793 / CGMCC 1.9160 / SL003B-26A1) TaxID=991905 RepID=F2IYI5_POLGS|nr:DUF2244 domain-containing protein [Polymorphum gilvum]ADZ68498.1 hypothetical protein SL003B_0060 [Polymorphum gilvum SL003B-26A1]